MRFFASWWERFPKHKAGTFVAVAIALGLTTANAHGIFHLLVKPTGFSWG
jgi:hypothetical protein